MQNTKSRKVQIQTKLNIYPKHRRTSTEIPSNPAIRDDMVNKQTSPHTQHTSPQKRSPRFISLEHRFFVQQTQVTQQYTNPKIFNKQTKITNLNIVFTNSIFDRSSHRNKATVKARIMKSYNHSSEHQTTYTDIKCKLMMW